MKITIKSISPIQHSGFEDFSSNNRRLFRKMPIIHDGVPVTLPVISGNSFRAKIRRSLAIEYFNRLQLKKRFEDEKTIVWDKFFSLLTNGGVLGKTLDTSIDPKEIAEIRKAIPILSTFGGTPYRYTLPGQVLVGFCILNCFENGKSLLPAAEQITEIGFTKSTDHTQENTAETGSKGMLFKIEAIIAGATWEGDIDYTPQATDLEKSCFIHGLNQITHLGGSLRAGFGKVEISGYDKTQEAQYLDFLSGKENDDKYIKTLIEYARYISV